MVDLFEEEKNEMKGKKRILFGFILLLAVNLYGCGNGSDEQQIVESFSIPKNNEDDKETLQEDSFTEEAPSNVTDSSQENDSASVGDTQQETDYPQQDNMPVSELPEKTKVNGSDDLETNSKQEFLMTGGIGNLGMGTLVYTVPDRDGEDYRLYFFQSGNGEERNLPLELSEASFVFPDVRDGNVPIGIFKEIYYMDYTDISRDGSSDVIVIAVYEKDGNEYYDTRVYEEGEQGFVVNIALTQELNEKYYNAEDYPVGEIVALPGE